jgi:5-methylcytosine-specific restriction endonuclease McrA
MLGLKTLVLQPNFLPKQIIPKLSTVSAEAALVSVMTGDVDCIRYYDRKVLTASRTDLQWPSIVVERKMYREYSEAKLSNAALFYRDHGYCQYCERPLTSTNVTRDHVIPRSKGGPDHWTNVVAACKTCNSAKDDKMPTGIWVPKRKPYQPSLAELFDRRKDFPVWVGEHIWTDYIGPWRGDVNLFSKFECEAV